MWGGAGQVAPSTAGRPSAPTCPAHLPREGDSTGRRGARSPRSVSFGGAHAGPSSYMAQEASTESITGHGGADVATQTHQGLQHLTALWACHLHLPPASAKGSMAPCYLGPSIPLTLPPTIPSLGGGPKWAAQRASGRAGRAPSGDRGGTWAQLLWERLWSGDMADRGKRNGREGTLGTRAFGHLSKDHVPRRGIRFLWTQCARGGRGSRLSSPPRAGEWVCWLPPRPRAPAAAALAAGCAGTFPHNSAAAASGTR